MTSMERMIPDSYSLESSLGIMNYGGIFDHSMAYQADFLGGSVMETQQSRHIELIDQDNKLLGFGAPILKSVMLDTAGQTCPRMTAELKGMFCVAEDVFERDSIGCPLELTCYRRNLFKISGSIALSSTAGHVLIDQCPIPIQGLLAVISATESIEGKPTEIVSVPWKAAANVATPQENVGLAPPSNIVIPLPSKQDSNSLFASIPIAWTRLQFKNATANNGRRKGLQQHYQIQITLMGELEGQDEPIRLAEIKSNSIIVRGRNPKNFDGSKDIPLRDLKYESAARIRMSNGVSNQSQSIDPDTQHGSYYPQTPHQLPMVGQLIPTLTSSFPEHSTKRSHDASPTSKQRRPPMPHWKLRAKDELQSFSPTPTVLSFTEDESVRSISVNLNLDVSIPPKHLLGTTGGRPIEVGKTRYEYFPLNLDDWMPPVDAIYRPHVDHHMHGPVDIKPQQAKLMPKSSLMAEL